MAKLAVEPAQPTIPSRLSAILVGRPKVAEEAIHKLNLGKACIFKSCRI